MDLAIAIECPQPAYVVWTYIDFIPTTFDQIHPRAAPEQEGCHVDKRCRLDSES